MSLLTTTAPLVVTFVVQACKSPLVPMRQFACIQGRAARLSKRRIAIAPPIWETLGTQAPGEGSAVMGSLRPTVMARWFASRKDRPVLAGLFRVQQRPQLPQQHTLTALAIWKTLGTQAPGEGSAVMGSLRPTVMARWSASRNDRPALAGLFRRQQRLPRMLTVRRLVEMLGTPAPGGGFAAMAVLQLTAMEHCTALLQGSLAPLELGQNRSDLSLSSEMNLFKKQGLQLE